MEADKEPTGVTRGQNAVQVVPMDWSDAERSLSTLIERIDTALAETQLLIITADAESAVAAARAVVDAAGVNQVTVVAATASARAARLLRTTAAHVVVGAPSDLVVLLQASALKPANVRGIVFAWLDPILETPDAAPLETLLGELPKEAARLVLATQLTPAYEALIERYARRARRPVEAAESAASPLNAEYVAVTPMTRASSLRRLLDALDLPRAVLYAKTPAARAEATAIVRSLGYSSGDVRIVGEATPSTNDAIVLVELPASREEMRTIIGEGLRKIYALAQASQLAGLRNLLGGGSATPIALIEAAERARSKDTALRTSLREVLASSDVRREVLALEPLLGEFDGLEIAAAALKLFEQQRPNRPVTATAQAVPMQKLFVNLGEKDGARTQEIITAITSVAGIPGSQVGRVEVRDTHAIVEVAESVAELVVTKLSGTSVRGRIVQARVDQPREAREERAPRGAGDRPSRPSPRGERPDRDRGARPDRDRGARPDRPPRSFDRGDRPSRPFDKGDRPARPFDKGDRPTRPFDRSDRPARPFDRGDKPARPFDRGDKPARPFSRGPRPSGAPDSRDRPPRPRRPRDE